ncbi:hypothetical protein SNEBB_007544 [Seison nebaliae]|nr:hypothetical protein SNEBB_007544 [Seison nebaliae]
MFQIVGDKTNKKRRPASILILFGIIFALVITGALGGAIGGITSVLSDDDDDATTVATTIATVAAATTTTVIKVDVSTTAKQDVTTTKSITGTTASPEGADGGELSTMNSPGEEGAAVLKNADCGDVGRARSSGNLDKKYEQWLKNLVL